MSIFCYGLFRFLLHAFVGVTVEEVGVAALLEDGGHLLGLVVVQLDLAITLITPRTHSHFFSGSPGALSAWNFI